MSKIKIIVCGYPKSGNTWLTRLTAELVGCPVVGFWNQPTNDDIAIEGSNRKSNYECYKAHQSLPELNKTFKGINNEFIKVIYIVRDPRDVVVSALHFFSQPFHPKTFRYFSKIRIRRLYFLLFENIQQRVEFMISNLLNGTSNLPWMSIPWGNHVNEYLDSGHLIVKYENLKRNTYEESCRILDYTGVVKSEGEIKKAIHIQSFANRKKKLEFENEKRGHKFLRKGEIGEWRNTFTAIQNKKICRELQQEMLRLSYLDPE